jgi:hypothetical protein
MCFTAVTLKAPAFFEAQHQNNVRDAIMATHTHHQHGVLQDFQRHIADAEGVLPPCSIAKLARCRPPGIVHSRAQGDANAEDFKAEADRVYGK